MARKSGGFNKFLNFIGLVDDGEPRDTYGEEYQSSNYGRQQPYVPATNRQRASGSGRPNNTRQQQGRTLPEAQRSSGRYDNRRPQQSHMSAQRNLNAYDGGQTRSARNYGSYDDNTTANRRGAGVRSANEVPAYDYSPRRERSSRFAEQTAPQQPVPARNPRANGRSRSRTVMFSLHTLEDCCGVIEELIANNSIVLTMEELEGSLHQRASDTLAGAVFALSASIRKVSDKTYLITPTSVEVNDGYEADRRY